MTEKEPQFESGKSVSKKEKGLYGLEPEMSLLSVNFAAKTENRFLNEHYEEDSRADE
jgi:hypothetical protein